jgi:hypothetical protein
MPTLPPTNHDADDVAIFATNAVPSDGGRPDPSVTPLSAKDTEAVVVARDEAA